MKQQNFPPSAAFFPLLARRHEEIFSFYLFPSFESCVFGHKQKMAMKNFPVFPRRKLFSRPFRLFLKLRRNFRRIQPIEPNHISPMTRQNWKPSAALPEKKSTRLLKKGCALLKDSQWNEIAALVRTPHCFFFLLASNKFFVFFQGVQTFYSQSLWKTVKYKKTDFNWLIKKREPSRVGIVCSTNTIIIPSFRAMMCKERRGRRRNGLLQHSREVSRTTSADEFFFVLIKSFSPIQRANSQR